MSFLAVRSRPGCLTDRNPLPCSFAPRLERSNFEKVKREAAAQRRPAQSERKTAFFLRNGRPYELKSNAFQSQHALSLWRRIFRAEDVLLRTKKDAVPEDGVLVFEKGRGKAARTC